MAVSSSEKVKSKALAAALICSCFMNIINNRPEIGEFQASGDITVGNYEYLKVSGVTNIPVSDQVALRFAAQDTSRDGYTTNLNPNQPGDIDSFESTNIRGQLYVEATDFIDALFSIEYYEKETFGPSYHPVASDCGDLFAAVDPSVAPCTSVNLRDVNCRMAGLPVM